MPTAARKFLAHVTALCKRHQITLTYDITDHGSAYANPVERRIGLTPITDDQSYADALHEIGHLVVEGAAPPPEVPGAYALHKLGVCTRADLQRAIKEEHLAWNWAMEQALVWTPAMTARRDEALKTYYDGVADLPVTLDPFAAFVRSRIEAAAARHAESLAKQAA